MSDETKDSLRLILHFMGGLVVGYAVGELAIRWWSL